jgi:hypothetical protein
MSVNGIMNVPKNLVAPFNSIDRVNGSVQKVFLEVFVSKVLRKLLDKRDPHSVMDLALIHTFSLPFIGGVNPYRQGDDANPFKASWVNGVISGVTEMPATYAGFYVNKVLNKGFVLPTMSFGDLLFFTAGKAISAAVTGLIGSTLNKIPILQKGNTAFYDLINRQQAVSNVNMN